LTSSKSSPRTKKTGYAWGREELTRGARTRDEGQETRDEGQETREGYRRRETVMKGEREERKEGGLTIFEEFMRPRVEQFHSAGRPCCPYIGALFFGPATF
jgi:hypothetical protein